MENDYEKWAPEYEPNEFEDDDKMLHIKEAVWNGLNTIQKKIFLTYCEIGTYAGTAREFGVCVPTVKKYLKHIKTLIYDRL